MECKQRSSNLSVAKYANVYSALAMMNIGYGVLQIIW